MQKPKLVYSTYIRTTPKEVWAAITKPEFTKQYWGGASNVSDWKKGSKWEHRFEEEADPVYIVGNVLESVPPKKLVVSWADPDKLAEKSRVTYEIVPLEGMVNLIVTHDKLKAGSPMTKGVSNGWPRVLSSLKTFLETGKGLPIFCDHK
jgi:uncharacterized protein YndB with AHSA1/START domain